MRDRDDEDVNFIRHEPCESCGSSDGNSLYSDGHTYCFACNAYKQGTADSAGIESIKNKMTNISFNGFTPIEGEYRALIKRGITEETCRRWGYSVGSIGGTTVQIASYKDEEGAIIAQKIRYLNKDFKFIGDARHVDLYGQWMWPDGGKMVVVTEGELDAMSVSQIEKHKWAVVSVPNGAQGASKSLKNSLDWLEKFERVILMFDMDEQGQKAARQCAQLFTPGKARIAKLPLKDANECLVAGRLEDVVRAKWDAKEYRPDGIIAGKDLWDTIIKQDIAESVPYPYDGLNKLTRGLRKGELVTVTAGSGIGKSQICREIAHHILMLGQNVGYIALEESVKRTALGILAIEMSKPLHLEMNVNEAELKSAFERTVGNGRFFTYDHWGSVDSVNLLSRIRYLARGCGCDFIVLDHLSIVVSGLGDGDERRLIDNTMTRLRALVEELKIGLIIVSHLKRPEGKGHEDGAKTSLSQLRGSAAIAQLSDMVIGLERNQQDMENKHKTCVRVLKNRFSGETGVACGLIFDPDSGRLTEDLSEVFNEGDEKKENETEDGGVDTDSFPDY